MADQQPNTNTPGLQPPNQPPKKSRKKLFIILAVLIVAGIVLKVYVFTGPFRYAGTVEATKVDISSQVPSTLAKVYFQEGEHVQENQPIIDMNCEDIKAASDLATANFSRGLRIFKGGASSEEAFDQVKNAKNEADIRVTWCSLKSPISGTVLSRYHEPGELVNPGTKLLTLANIKDVWAYIYVAQPEVSQLKPGMKLTAYLPELHDRQFIGTIFKINSEAEFTPKNVQTRTERQRLIYGVRVSFLGVNDDEVLKPGMTVEVELPKNP